VVAVGRTAETDQGNEYDTDGEHVRSRRNKSGHKGRGYTVHRAATSAGEERRRGIIHRWHRWAQMFGTELLTE
jgi:hypothetical protein